jgi:hypothetical protein
MLWHYLLILIKNIFLIRNYNSPRRQLNCLGASYGATASAFSPALIRKWRIGNELVAKRSRRLPRSHTYVHHNVFHSENFDNKFCSRMDRSSQIQAARSQVQSRHCCRHTTLLRPPYATHENGLTPTTTTHTVFVSWQIQLIKNYCLTIVETVILCRSFIVSKHAGGGRLRYWF